MAISTMKQNGHTAYNNIEFVIDTKSDVENLPTTCSPGSIAFCVEDSSVYMLNNQKVWSEI